MAGMLLVTAGSEFARTVFRTRREGYWSAALPIVFEQHGFLDFEVAGPEALQDRSVFGGGRVVLIARLPDELWDDGLVEAVVSSRSPVLVEGPLPQKLGDALGVQGPSPGGVSMRVTLIDGELRERAKAFGLPPGGNMRPPEVRAVERTAETDWARTRGVGLSEPQATAWQLPAWRVDCWDGVGDGAVLAEIGSSTGEGDVHPAIARFGQVVACSFSLFGFLGQMRTSEPFEPGEHRSSGRTVGVDAVLLALLDDLHARAGLTRARMLPWPAGVDWVLNVRHDFDRPLDAGAVKAILKKHRVAGTSATWYWRARHVRGRGSEQGVAAVKAVARDPAHEVALHTENQFTDPRERTDLEKAARVVLRGTTAHGDPNCFRYQGAPNVLWADREGFDYTELIQHAHFHPHRFAALGPDGEIEVKRIICLPHHESFDLSTTPGDINAERVGELPTLWGEPGGFVQVLNHPDINVDLLFEALATLPGDGHVEWTAAQASDWWRRTHVSGELTFERRDAESVTVESRIGVYGAVLELRGPDGGAQCFVLDLEPRTPVTITAGAHGTLTSSPRALPSNAQVRWDRDVGPAFVGRIRSYYVERGVDPDAATSQTTLRTNSELVPSRAADVLAYMDALAGLGGLEGRRVLEAGCGFGALATYLALAHRPAAVTGVDHEPAFLDVAREVAVTCELSTHLDFVQADLRDLRSLGEEPFDVVIANNALLYLTAEEDLDACLRELRRVLKPGGVLFVHQANRLRWRDPFTGAPAVTLVPSWAVNGVTRLTRREHSLNRVRLISAAELGRALGRAGFEDPQLGAMERGRVTKRVRFARFIAGVGKA